MTEPYIEKYADLRRRHMEERAENLKAAIIQANGSPKKAAAIIGVNRSYFVNMFYHFVGMSAKKFMESRNSKRP